MQVHYVPLLQELHRLYSQPRSMERFRDYLKTMTTSDRQDVEYPPLVMINPMAREHLLEIVETLLGFQADDVARNALADAALRAGHVSGEFSASLVVVDDLKGGWTNRFAYELGLRKIAAPHELPPRQARRFWVTGVLWSSEPPVPEAVRRAMTSALLRTAWVIKHGGARSLRELLNQEGWVLLQSGCEFEPLEDEERNWIRDVVDELGDSTDTATLIAALFGDEAAATLGHAPLGIPAWGGLRWAREHTATAGRLLKPCTDRAS